MHRRYLFLLALICAAIVYALTVATGSDSSLSQYFWGIIAAAGLMVSVLLILVLRYGWLLLRHSQQNMLGSRLARRLALMFALVAVLPGLFLAGVSAQFISYSIKSWFGNDTAQALESSLTLSKSALDAALDQSMRQAAVVQIQIISGTAMGGSAADILRRSGEAASFPQIGIYHPQSGRTELVRNENKLPLPQPENGVAAALAQSGSSRAIVSLNGRLYAQGWLALPPQADGGEQALFFRRPVPANVARDAELIEAARSKYAELTYAKQGLQTFFLITLLAAALLSVMLALVIALYFSRRFIEPILSLSEGAQAVAEGDFTQRRPVYRNDELGRLTRLFNHMTEQLAIASDAEKLNRLKQEAARHYLETVLESLTAGVITFDEKGRLKTLNRSAEHILGLPLSEMAGSSWHDWPQDVPQYAELAALFQTVSAQTGRSIQTAYTPEGGSPRILLAKAAPLPADNGGGLVLVFDDITLSVRAQKEAAWGEVAKRLAHEIRNPLTPIRLSAERLAWKLHDKLDGADAQILTRSTDTIVKQVEAMQEMVEAFRNYARAPDLKPQKQDLNRLIEEVRLLYEGGACTFEAQLSKIPAMADADTTAMRQVLHNLFKNAAEAAETAEHPRVLVRTENHGGEIILTVANNGKSFSPEMLHNAFEPYVTDKPTGTGLGLPVVKKIIEEHGGRIEAANPPEGGACITITLPALAESEHEK